MNRTSNSSASTSGVSSEARIAANVAQALAQVAGQVQAQPLANLSERERAIERAALRLLALLPPSGSGPNPPGALPASASEPLLIENPDDYRQMQLPKDVWQQIFKLLDETALGCIRQSCRRFHRAANGLSLNFLNPQSELGQKQRDICRKVLASILDECPRPTEANPSPDYQPTILRFKQALQAFASRYRCVEVRVMPGFEQAVVDALKDARCWQSLHIRFPTILGGGADVQKLMSQLRQSLSAQQRQVALDLKIDLAPPSWPKLLTETAFTFTGLHVSSVDYDALEQAQPLQDLLSGQNALDCFEIAGDPSPDPILPWVKAGSHNLTSLLLHDMPEDGQLLIDVLCTKPKLCVLALDNGSFKEGGLTLAQVLRAAPGLKTLSLAGVFFEVGGSAGCLQALRDSGLREIEFSNCWLKVGHAQGDLFGKLREAHRELLQGLREAPHLEVLKVTELDDPGKPQLALLLAGAFVGNPAAKTLCILDDRAGSRFEEIVGQANAQRARQNLPALDLKMEPAAASEDDDDSDRMAILLKQFHPMDQDEMEVDDGEVDDGEEDEMNDDTPDDMRDDSND